MKSNLKLSLNIQLSSEIFNTGEYFFFNNNKKKGQYPMGDGELGYEAGNLVHLAVP